ncbi:MAG TPA: TIM barrel protein [Longimicrobiaceae bacterium]|nr:TIM barrel protein [Longimicrobiaceae bacterium]
MKPFGSSLVLAAALLLPLTSLAQAAPHTLALKGDFHGPLGIQLWSVRNQMAKDVPGTLAWVHDQGFREVELAGTYGLGAEQFRQALDHAGLRATSMHVDYDALSDSLDKVLDHARTLGVQYIGVAWIPHQGQFNPEMARKAAADFNRFGKAAHQRGMQFFYHTHGYEFQPAADGTIPFDVLVRATDPQDVKYEMDVFWVTRPGQNPVALLQEYPGRWMLMHVKGMKKGTPTHDFSGGAPADAEVAVGQGQIDYPAILRTAAKLGLKEYYIEDETTDPIGNIPQSIRFLETVRF